MKKVLFETHLTDGLFEVGTLCFGTMVQLRKNDSKDSIWIVQGLDKDSWLVQLKCVSSRLYCPGTIIYLDSQVKVKCWSKFQLVNESEAL